MLAIRHRIALIPARMWDVRREYDTCAMDTQWSCSHIQHHMQGHCHSYTICAAFASPMPHWYAVDTQHRRNSSTRDVPPNHLGNHTVYFFIFMYTVWAPWHRRPVEQGITWIARHCLKVIDQECYDIHHWSFAYQNHVTNLIIYIIWHNLKMYFGFISCPNWYLRYTQVLSWIWKKTTACCLCGKLSIQSDPTQHDLKLHDIVQKSAILRYFIVILGLL